jgi:flagellar hook-basal body complex protein FliE
MSNISAVDGLLAQMRAAAAAASLSPPSVSAVDTQPASKVSFTGALKNALDSVAQSQAVSESMQKAFVSGNENVSLSDTMIAMQKASINLQTAVQVRSKLVQAYNDIMNMQV